MAAQTSVWTVVAAVALSAVTSYFVGRQSATCARESGDAGRLAEATRELTRAVEGLKERSAAPAKLETASRPAPESGSSTPLASAGAPGRVASDVPGAPPVARSEREATQMLPRADLSKAAELEAWDEKEDVRRRWMFLSESGLLATFGTPDEVWANDAATEIWSYKTDTVELICTLMRGRLTRVKVNKKEPGPPSDDR